MEKEIIIVSQDDINSRLDVFLTGKYTNLSRSYIQKLIGKGLIKVNGQRRKNRYLIKNGDQINVKIPVVKEKKPEPQNIPLDIIYEDDDLLIVNKPQKMVVHPAPGHCKDTLVNALLYHCKGKLSTVNDIIRPGIVHRIDKDTSGLLMVAKTNQAHMSLAKQLKEYLVTRKYHAITLGRIKEEKLTIDAPIGRHPINRIKMAVIEDGRKAITHVTVLKELGEYTYVEAELTTGRTHQIRVHLSDINHPILGDKIYGGNRKRFNLPGQVLHAKILGFLHPIKGEYMEFESPLPEDFSRILRIIENTNS